MVLEASLPNFIVKRSYLLAENAAPCHRAGTNWLDYAYLPKA